MASAISMRKLLNAKIVHLLVQCFGKFRLTIDYDWADGNCKAALKVMRKEEEER